MWGRTPAVALLAVLVWAAAPAAEPASGGGPGAPPAGMPAKPAVFLDQLARLTYASLTAERSTDNALPWSWWSETLAGGDYCNPAEIGFYLLAHLCAYDYGADWSPTWEQTAGAMSATLDVLAAWQASEVDTYHGDGAKGDGPAGVPPAKEATRSALFYRGYWLNPTPRVGDGGYNHEVPSVDNAWLAAALLTVRGFCATHPHLAGAGTVAAKCAAVLAPMDFVAWYDPTTHLFRWGGPNDPLGGGWADYYSNENRIINMVARCQARLNGTAGFEAAEFADSLAVLVQAAGEYDGITVGRVAYDGSLFTYLLPAQFVREMETPYGADTIDAAVATQRRYAENHGRIAFGVSDGYGPGDQGYQERGAPPRGSGDDNNDLDDGLVVPAALGLALVSSHAERSAEVLAYLADTFPACFSSEYGFRASVNVVSGLASRRFTALDQGMLLLALANRARGTVWRGFYANPAVAAVHAEAFGAVPADITPPFVTDLDSTSPDGTYGVGAQIDLAVAFSEAVTVTGTPALTLETGTVDGAATYIGGSGTAVLTFRYVVGATDASPDLDAAGADALALAGASIADAAGHPADVTLPPPGAPHSLGANRALVLSTQHLLSYAAGPDGTLIGNTQQRVLHGADGSPVRAIPASGYLFANWSDGSTDNPRRDVAVAADVTVTAAFAPAATCPPEGDFVARIGRDGALAGDGLWNLTGNYATTVAGAPLTMALLHDPGGALTGTGWYAPAKAAAVALTIKGRVRGDAGVVTLNGTLEGRSPATGQSVSLTLNLTLDALHCRICGPLTGRLRGDAANTRVSEMLELAVPAPMDGTWALELELRRVDDRRVTGTALVRLSNGACHPCAVRGKVVGADVMLTLAGGGASRTGRALRILTTLMPLADGRALPRSLSVRAYGEQIAW